MFDLFSIIYFTPFYFPNGKSSPKNKYFIPIHEDSNGKIIFAYLPTSQDYVPDKYLNHGCIEVKTENISCYLFAKDRIITDRGFSFPFNTFVYAYQMNEFSKEIMESVYENENVDYEVIGRLTKKERDSFIKCLINSPSVKRKIKKILADIN
ncbi:hypothetical protein [Maribacter sp. 2304DJ31-5]|uniref:hypothetical protein n=1 Tax=Maribacter sp. 2304DJ31-5 TaxID=3386273 RepID=UPI0039BCFE04